MDKKIIVGSRTFFSGMEGFSSKDIDYLVLDDEPKGYVWRREQSLRGVCTFRYKREPVGKMVEKTLENGDALLLGKFLVPEVAQELGATIEAIKPLEVLLPKLDDAHKYVEVIFNAYIENNGFTLTDEQRAAAFEVYKQAREKTRDKDRRRRAEDEEQVEDNPAPNDEQTEEQDNGEQDNQMAEKQ